MQRGDIWQDEQTGDRYEVVEASEEERPDGTVVSTVTSRLLP